MDEARLRGLMGLCVRARQAVFGEDGCMKAIRTGSCHLLLLDGGASDATKKKYRSACENAGVLMGEIPENLMLEATSRPGVAMAVTQEGLARQMIRLLWPEGPEAQPMKSANNCGGASVE